MANRPFFADPKDHIFRAVKNGDDAVSPASADNIVFDLFSAPYMGVFMAGQFASSSLSLTSHTVLGGGGTVDLYQTVINFSKTFASPPQLLWLCQNPATGGWCNQYMNGSFAYSGSGVIVNPDGSISGAGGGSGSGRYLTAFGYCTTTGVILGYRIDARSSSASVTPPSNFSYRVFQF